MSDRLEEIKKRAGMQASADWRERHEFEDLADVWYAEDVPYLLARIEALTKAGDRLAADMHIMHDLKCSKCGAARSMAAWEKERGQ